MTERLHLSSRGIAGLFLAIAATACAHASNVQTAAAPSPGPQSAPPPKVTNPADTARYAVTDADIQFMKGMIGHHGQALVMAGWAPSHGASPSVRTLCERIINEQGDEIATMSQWLRDHGQTPPDPHAPMTMMMNGKEMPMLMPGMLTDEQMKELDAARGQDFDRLFLTYMIQHHKGAVSMVHDLFESQGAGQDEAVFKFASDVNVDQTTEIARMQKMLFAVEVLGAQ
jgi:uncharacterized protein (DUF305 family)